MRALKAFRDNYPKGRNIFCSPQIAKPYSRMLEGYEITFANAFDLRTILLNSLKQAFGSMILVSL
jgi:hypothetical protein